MVAIITTCKCKEADLDSSVSRLKSESTRAEGCQVWVAVEEARSACTSKLCHALSGWARTVKALIPVCGTEVGYTNLSFSTH